jgi:hypothetical protein
MSKGERSAMYRASGRGDSWNGGTDYSLSVLAGAAEERDSASYRRPQLVAGDHLAAIQPARLRAGVRARGRGHRAAEPKHLRIEGATVKAIKVQALKLVSVGPGAGWFRIRATSRPPLRHRVET